MSDIPPWRSIRERLREEASFHGVPNSLEAEAADEIERLEAKCVQVDRYIALLNDEIADNGKLRDEIERLTEQLHYANGTCDLAMKHRDAAEAEIERLRDVAVGELPGDDGTSVAVGGEPGASAGSPE